MKKYLFAILCFFTYAPNQILESEFRQGSLTKETKNLILLLSNSMKLLVSKPSDPYWKSAELFLDSLDIPLTFILKDKKVALNFIQSMIDNIDIKEKNALLEKITPITNELINTAIKLVLDKGQELGGESLINTLKNAPWNLYRGFLLYQNLQSQGKLEEGPNEERRAQEGEQPKIISQIEKMNQNNLNKKQQKEVTEAMESINKTMENDGEYFKNLVATNDFYEFWQNSSKKTTELSEIIQIPLDQLVLTCIQSMPQISEFFFESFENFIHKNANHLITYENFNALKEVREGMKRSFEESKVEAEKQAYEINQKIISFNKDIQDKHPANTPVSSSKQRNTKYYVIAGISIILLAGVAYYLYNQNQKNEL